jgi:hypothetical protein
LHFFDTNKTKPWNVVDPVQTLPEFVPHFEARGFYQDPTNYHGYLSGNKYTLWCHVVGDLVQKFSLSIAPANQTITFENLSRLPLQAHFGSDVGEVLPSSGRLMLVGGSTAVGPNPTNKAWFWDQSRVPLTALEQQCLDLGDNQPAPRLAVISAKFGPNDVMHTVQMLLDKGWTEFVHDVMLDLGLVEDWQWRDGTCSRCIEKKRNGKIYRAGIAIDQLTFTL